jgi:hypothetical protein
MPNECVIVGECSANEISFRSANFVQLRLKDCNEAKVQGEIIPLNALFRPYSWIHPSSSVLELSTSSGRLSVDDQKTSCMLETYA